MPIVDNAAKIATLEGLLASGTLTVTVDGFTTTFRSRAELIAELRRLRLTDNTGTQTKPAPRNRTVYLGGF